MILAATSVPLPGGPSPTGLPLDKAVHLLLYLGLGWSSGRALLRSWGPRPGPTVATWAAGLVFAAADEGHQAWLPGREASALDWAADAVGLTAGLALLLVLEGRRRTGTARGGGRTASTRGDGGSRNEEPDGDE